jgi:hypothetical protein
VSLAQLTSKQTQQDLKISDLSDRLDEMKYEIHQGIHDEIQDRIRRGKNVLISGISEHINGNVEERHKKDLKQVEAPFQTLHVDLKGAPRVSRIGKIKPNSHRLIRVTLSCEEEVSQLLRSAKSLRSHNEFKKVFLNPDRTPAQQLKFADLLRELRARRDLGEEVVIFRGKVIAKEILERGNHQNFH